MQATGILHTLLTGILPLMVLLSLGFAPGAVAGSSGSDGKSGSYPGRVLDEILRHRQSVLQRGRLSFQTQQAGTPSAAVDVGEIAVLTDDGTLVSVANSFDLDQKSLLFQPAAGGHTVLAGTGGFDAAAAAQGILLNPSPASNPQNIGDDGSREVAIGFSFSFFGTSYTSVFVNSDGNLTFGAGDTASTARSLGRFLAGPPRIAPYFADLDPSVAGQLTYLSTASRFVVTWSQVPDFTSFGIGPRETFQVSLTPDGSIQFSYSGINGREAVVGISPGGVNEAPSALDLGSTDGSQTIAGSIAEVFTLSTELDLVAVAQRFYQTHDDSYQFLIVFTTFNFNLNGAFAFETNIANDVTGIGPIGNTPTFDFSDQFGSVRLESMLNMGNLSKYPADPSQIFFPGVNSTLSIMGQESGHRFLAYARFRDPETNANSTAWLGRALQHWSFFFNSDASVMEGNRIRDNGDGTFTTIGANEHYNEIDQYIMGLLPPEEVNPSFLVKNPSAGLSPGAAPALGVTFSGRRVNITIDDIIAANGPRVPNSVTARKRYNYAFILVTERGTQATDSQVAHLDRIRRDWESFYTQATSSRSIASTSLLRSLQISPETLGMLAGNQRQLRVERSGATGINLPVTLSNSNPTAVSVPGQVVIPAGSPSGLFTVTALNAGVNLSEGRAVIAASSPGFETADLVVQVAPQSSTGLSLAIAGGDDQVAAPGSALPAPLQVSLRDSNQIPYPGQTVIFSVIEGDASASPEASATDTDGKATSIVQLGGTTGPVTIRARVSGTPLSVDFSITALGVPQVLPLGVFNAASYSPSPTPSPTVALSSPGALISISGTNLAPVTALASALPLPISLEGVSVEIGGIRAPLLYVSPFQIFVQVPFELAFSVLTLQVQNTAGNSSPIFLSVQGAFPGIFTLGANGTGPGAILHTATQLPVTSQSPAAPGGSVEVFATGLGRVSPAVPSGQPAGSQPPSTTNLPATVTVNGVPALVSAARLAPGFTGLYQLSVQVPEVTAGAAAVVLTMNGVDSQTVTMAVGSN